LIIGFVNCAVVCVGLLEHESGGEAFSTHRAPFASMNRMAVVGKVMDVFTIEVGQLVEDRHIGGETNMMSIP